MPKPTLQQRYRRRRAGLVFIPPLLMFAAGAWLLGQATDAGTPTGSAGSSAATNSAAETTEPQPTTDPGLARIAELRPLIDEVGSELYVVNKLRPLAPPDYEPADLTQPTSSESLDNSRGQQLTRAASAALAELSAEMHASGLGLLFVNSGYRSYQTQVDLFQAKIEQYGEAKALLHSAKPGHSEHQTGLAVDVSMVGQGCAILACFGSTEAGKWLAEEGWRHGFIVRYPDGWQPTTGYTYEPWHLRYVGPEVAELYQLSRKGTLEDFWGLPPAPDYAS